MTRTEAASWLQQQDHYCILTHRNPDGDTIGCAAALCRGLRALGKTAHVLENSQFTARYDSYLSGLTKPHIEPGDTVISTDIAAESLLPYGEAAAQSGSIVFAVDHHGSNTGFAPNLYLDPHAAACGELIYDLLTELQVAISPEIAACLYLAISTDTGCFQYSNTTANTLRVAAALKDAGCDTYAINKIFFGTKTLSRLQLEARLTESMELLADGNIAVCRLPLQWMDELALTEDDIDSIAGFPRAVEGVEIGVMIRQMTNGSEKISMRTGPRYNASAICSHLGGGGHAAAAGATVAMEFAAARDAVIAAIRAEGIEV